ncbi:MAG: hypothetical protein ACOVP1_02990 [Bacteroidia bacterium]
MKKLLYFGFLLFIFSCSKEKDCSKVPTKLITANVFLLDSERTYLPYNGTETLMFISNKGDTAVLKGTGTIQKYNKERIVSINEYPSCPQTEVHLHETLAAEFKGTNPNFSHFKIEQFMSSSYYSIFRFYFNNKMESVSNTYPYEWGGGSAYFFAKGIYEKLPITTALEFRGSSIIALDFNLFSGFPYPKFIFYRNFGIIGCRIDSSTVYTLQ